VDRSDLRIVFGILSVLLALAQDQHTIKVESAYGAEDPKFASYVGARQRRANGRQSLSGPGERL